MLAPGSIEFKQASASARGLVLAGVALVSMMAASCGEEEPTDYTAAHREAFLSACSRPLDDPRLLSDVCGCVYDRIEDEMSFTEFERISGRIVAPGAELPGGIADMVAECFVSEADL